MAVASVSPRSTSTASSVTPSKLLSDLNAHVERFNTDKAQKDRIPPFEMGDLSKLAFWSATGSGKTLLMHVNILQYRHYLELHGQGRELNRIILLTPNEGLSRSTLRNSRLSGMEAALFSKDGAACSPDKIIEIIDIHKLREEMGEKTVAIDAFEGNNLVLVDEGHRGASGKEVGRWMQARNRLCEKGFSFEYSATFGQAMKASSNAPGAGVRQVHPVRLLLQVFLQGRIREGLPHPEPCRRLATRRSASST